MESKRTRWDELVAVGLAVKPQGRRGELLVHPLGGLSAFEGIDRVFLEIVPGEASSLSVEHVRIHKGRPVLKLEGVSEIGQAEALRGKELRVPAETLEPLPSDSYYQFELRGLEVSDRKVGTIGLVEEVLSTGGTDVLVVRRPSGEETLVPFCREICVRIDPAEGIIELIAPEGLVELNAN